MTSVSFNYYLTLIDENINGLTVFHAHLKHHLVCAWILQSPLFWWPLYLVFVSFTSLLIWRPFNLAFLSHLDISQYVKNTLT